MPLTLSGTGGITYPDGSVNATRSVSTAGDTMTGLLNLPSNGLAVGTNQLVVSVGNVGMGTAPHADARLTVSGRAAFADDGMGQDTTAYGSTGVTRSAAGTATKSYYALTRAGQFVWGLGISSNSSFSIGIPNTSREFASEAMRIDTNNRIQMNTTAGNKYSATLTLVKTNNSYNITSSVAGTGSEGHVVFENGNANAVGTIFTNGSSTLYNTTSDYRLKENVAPMTGALTKITALKPVTYTWKSDGSASQGFIAHELQAVVPECVTGEKDAFERLGNILDAEGEVLEENVQEPTEGSQIAGQTWVYTKDRPRYQGVDASFLIATLTAAIQEQQAIIQSLTARIEALEAV